MNKLKHVLLVDDNEADNHFHQLVIQKSGIPVKVSTITHSGKALQCWSEIALDTVPGKIVPELVFLDINMPGFNGFDLLEKLIQIPDPLNRKNKMKIFILSTTSNPDHFLLVVEKYRNFVSGFFTKPLTSETFSEIVAMHFEQAPGLSVGTIVSELL